MALDLVLLFSSLDGLASLRLRDGTREGKSVNVPRALGTVMKSIQSIHQTIDLDDLFKSFLFLSY